MNVSKLVVFVVINPGHPDEDVVVFSERVFAERFVERYHHLGLKLLRRTVREK